MASALSKKQEVEVLNHIFGKTTANKPAEYWLALCKAEPTRAQESTTLEEVAYTGYARLNVKPTAFEEAKEGAGAEASYIQNGETLTFANCTAGEAKSKWVAVVTVAKVSEAGRVIAWGELAAELTINVTNTPVRFEAKELKITAY